MSCVARHVGPGSPGALDAASLVQTGTRQEVAPEVRPMRLTKNLGMLALAIYLILVGISGLGLISVAGLGTITAVLAIAAGILILIGR